MSYNPLTDFLALIRTASGVASVAEIPGLDFVLSALARAGMFTMYAGQSEPTSNQLTTLWFKPSLPSWAAEGTPYIYDTEAAAYAVATPALWTAFLTRIGSSTFQSVTQAAAAVNVDTAILAIERAAPAVTVLTLPSVLARAGRALQVVDWSSGVTNHTVMLSPAAGQTIMRLTSFQLLSSADQLAGLTLYPVIDLDGWIIAP